MTTSQILLAPTDSKWVSVVQENLDEFLSDHAANERKASAMAMSLVAHYPDKEMLVTAMIDLALEELTHFKQVVRLMQTRGLVMLPDEKDAYVNQIRKHIRQGPDEYFLDRLLTGAVIEARGEERFRQLSEHLEDSELRAFYGALANSERGHHELFIRLARSYFDDTTINNRLAVWLDIEQTVIATLPLRSRLH